MSRGPYQPEPWRILLGIGKLRAGQGGYYLSAVAEGVEDYYVGGEAPGEWIASSDSLVGLAGPVRGDDLVAMLEGRDPATGSRLGRAHKVPGFDLTFSAPKSCLLYTSPSPRD